MIEKDKMMNLRCEKELYNDFFRIVKENDRHVSQVVRDFMRYYVKVDGKWDENLRYND